MELTTRHFIALLPLLVIATSTVLVMLAIAWRRHQPAERGGIQAHPIDAAGQRQRAEQEAHGEVQARRDAERKQRQAAESRRRSELELKRMSETRAENELAGERAARDRARPADAKLSRLPFNGRG